MGAITLLQRVPIEVWALILSGIAVVFTALKDFIIPFFFRPKISIETNNNDCIENITSGTIVKHGKRIFGAAPSRWLRLKIKNGSGFCRRPARNCYVKLFEVRDSSNRKVVPFSPFLLKWGTYETRKGDLAPGEYHFVDLVHEKPGLSKLWIQGPVPEEFQNKLLPDLYTFKVSAFGDNFNPVSSEFKILFGKKFGELRFIEK